MSTSIDRLPTAIYLTLDDVEAVRLWMTSHIRGAQSTESTALDIEEQLSDSLFIDRAIISLFSNPKEHLFKPICEATTLIEAFNTYVGLFEMLPSFNFVSIARDASQQTLAHIAILLLPSQVKGYLIPDFMRDSKLDNIDSELLKMMSNMDAYEAMNKLYNMGYLDSSQHSEETIAVFTKLVTAPARGVTYVLSNYDDDIVDETSLNDVHTLIVDENGNVSDIQELTTGFELPRLQSLRSTIECLLTPECIRRYIAMQHVIKHLSSSLFSSVKPNLKSPAAEKVTKPHTTDEEPLSQQPEDDFELFTGALPSPSPGHSDLLYHKPSAFVVKMDDDQPCKYSVVGRAGDSSRDLTPVLSYELPIALKYGFRFPMSLTAGVEKAPTPPLQDCHKLECSCCLSPR